MNQPHQQIVLVTVLALLVYIWTAIRVARARREFRIAAPAMIGDPIFERHVRVQANTLEWLVAFIPSLWMFSQYWPQLFGALLGALWIVGRVIYAPLYVRDPNARHLAFGLQALATLALLAGAVVGAFRVMAIAGGV